MAHILISFSSSFVYVFTFSVRDPWNLKAKINYSFPPFLLFPIVFSYQVAYYIYFFIFLYQNVSSVRADTLKKKKFMYLFNWLIYFIFWLWWVFIAILGAFSNCSKWGSTLHCSGWASHCNGFSCCKARVLRLAGSVVTAHRLSSCSSLTLEHRLSIWGTRI